MRSGPESGDQGPQGVDRGRGGFGDFVGRRREQRGQDGLAAPGLDQGGERGRGPGDGGGPGLEALGADGGRGGLGDTVVFVSFFF